VCGQEEGQANGLADDSQTFFKSKKNYQKVLEEHVEKLSSLQRLHYASKPLRAAAYFSGDGCRGKRRRHPARHVRGQPQGCQVFSFKQPSAEELKHDFFWRTTLHLPERGRIGIFIVPTMRCAHRARASGDAKAARASDELITRSPFGRKGIIP